MPRRRSLFPAIARRIESGGIANGKLALMNCDDDDATIRLASGRIIQMSPYTIVLDHAGAR